MSRHHHTLRGHHLSSFFVFFMNSQISSTSTLVKLRFCRKYFVTSSQWVPAISSHFEIVSLSRPVALATPRILPFSGIIASVLRTSSRGVSSPENTVPLVSLKKSLNVLHLRSARLSLPYLCLMTIFQWFCFPYSGYSSFQHQNCDKSISDAIFTHLNRIYN